MSLTPSAIYINMEPTFSERTTKRLLYELRDEGLVEVLDRPGSYYRITEEGIAYLQESDKQ
jgi:DNA-binding PadR family transcriptional regulator